MQHELVLMNYLFKEVAEEPSHQCSSSHPFIQNLAAEKGNFSLLSQLGAGGL